MVPARYHHAIVSTSPLSSEGPFGRFADQLLALELPDLPDETRDDTVAFVCRRAGETPSPLRLGVTVLAIGVGVGQRVLGNERTTAFVGSTTLPFVGELARMVRSLGFAYIWESWPTTSPTGAPAPVGAP